MNISSISTDERFNFMPSPYWHTPGSFYVPQRARWQESWKDENEKIVLALEAM